MVQGALNPAAEVGQWDEFIDLICADADLLRTEFEQIVAAGWSSTPPPERGDVPDPGTHGPGFRHPAAEARQRPPAGPDDPGVGSRSRQRSPPPERCEPIDIGCRSRIT